MKAIIIDTETTGLLKPSGSPLEAQPHIIELAAIVVENGVLEHELSLLFKPPIAIPEVITKITGIDSVMLTSARSFGEELMRVRDFFAKAACDFLIAHNANFDLGILRNELQRAGCHDFPWPAKTICTVQEYVPLFGRRPKLSELYKRLTGREIGAAHRALADVKSLNEALMAGDFYSSLAAAK